jgi:predicted transporter
MTNFELIAGAAFALAAILMLLVTQTKRRVPQATWLIPTVALVSLAALIGFAILQQEQSNFWPLVTGSSVGLIVWIDRLMAVTVAFFLLQNRARAVNMKSEAWVLGAIFTGSLGLLMMLARTLYLERKQPAPGDH